MIDMKISFASPLSIIIEPWTRLKLLFNVLIVVGKPIPKYHFFGILNFA